MRFITVLGTLIKGRRYVAGSSSITAEEIKDQEKLSSAIRDILIRLFALESAAPLEATEFEVEVSNAGTKVRLEHGFGLPVRYYVVTWTKKTAVGSTYPSTGPILVMDASSDLNNLVLQSYVAGRAIIRVEPAQAGIGI